MVFLVDRLPVDIVRIDGAASRNIAGREFHSNPTDIRLIVLPVQSQTASAA